MTQYTTKMAHYDCYNCGGEREFEETYLRGQMVQNMCTECGEVDDFPYDDED